MSMFAKIMVVVNLVLAVIFLAAAGTLHGAAESWKAKHEALVETSKRDIKAVEEQRNQREKELNATKDAQRASDTRASAAEAVQKTQAESMAALKAENDRVKAENAQHVTNAGDLGKTISDLNGRNKELSDQLATATADKKGAQDENTTLKENLARETTRADDAEKAVAAGEAARVKQAEELDKTSTHLAAMIKSYGPLPGGVSMKPVTGVVAATDAKADVHVISVGTKDGVEVGYEFTVFRGSEYVSTIVIDWVNPTSAAGRTKTGMKKSEVKSGDSVSTKL